MVKQSLTIALVKSILQVLDRVGPTELRRRRCRRRGQRSTRHRRPVPKGSLCDVPPSSNDGQSKLGSLRDVIIEVMMHNTSHTRIRPIKCSES
jgi:hypothetical protein